MRITIKPYLTHYVAQIGSQLGIDDFTEVVSIILLDHKRGLCHCSQPRSALTEAPTAPAENPNETLADSLEELLNSASY